MLNTVSHYTIYVLEKNISSSDTLQLKKIDVPDDKVFITEEEAKEYLKEIEHRNMQFVILPVWEVENIKP